MTSIASRYDRLSAAFAARVAAVPEDAWSAPSPCEDWTARDVVRHVVDSHATFVGFIDRDLPGGPEVDEDPAGAFDRARRTVSDLLHDPATAGQVYEGHFGPRPFEWAVDSFLSFDLVVHGWDLARSTGQDDTIADEDLDRIVEDARSWGETARAPGVFGPEVEPPPDADRQTRVLAFLGRRA